MKECSEAEGTCACVCVCKGRVVFRDHGGALELDSGEKKSRWTWSEEGKGKEGRGRPRCVWVGERRSKRAIMFGCDGFRYYPLRGQDNGDIHAIG